MIRVRFAPSPTGYLHVGGARTALFNWLFARHQGGVFVLRIEDTDVERSSADMVEGILDGLRWLGLDWDEGPKIGGPYEPYLQSGRIDRYRATAEQLVSKGLAYYCYCTSDELKTRRDAAERATGGWIYDRACLALTPDEIRSRDARGMSRAVRFRVPGGAVAFDDLVHGPIEFDGAHIEDFVILRSDGHPTYHLSAVSDDVEMRITHVVRGDDHISNTPKQLLLYRALDAPIPKFAHVPLILGPDKKRLSKRHGATSVMEYARQGYLPEAMVNFLALLGWSRGNQRNQGQQVSGTDAVGAEQELFSTAELIDAFDLDGIGGGSAVFNQDKLDWFNQQHIFRLAPEELGSRLRPWFEGAGLWDPAYLGERHAWFFAVLELLKPRAKRLNEFVSLGKFFFVDQVEYDEASVSNHLRVANMAEQLTAVDAAFAELETFDPVSIEAALRGVADAQGVKAATLIHALRVAITGRSVSPGLFDVASLVGRTRTRARIARAVLLISSPRG